MSKLFTKDYEKQFKQVHHVAEVYFNFNKLSKRQLHLKNFMFDVFKHVFYTLFHDFSYKSCWNIVTNKLQKQD